jgi:hypothetical protein
MKNTFIILIGLLFLVPMILYFIIFHGNISSEHSHWTEFSTIWAGFIGTSISSITIAYLVFDKIENSKYKNEQLFQQQLNIYFKQLEKLSLLYPLYNNKNCFAQFIEIIEQNVRKHFDLYFYYYYSSTDILEWPNHAFEYFIKNAYIPLQLKKDFPDLEYNIYSKSDKKYIEEKWFKYADGNIKTKLVESLKGFFDRPLKDPDECMEIFAAFTDICGTTKYNIKNLYNVAFQNAMNEFNNSLDSYFEMHSHTVKILKKHDELLTLYLSQITGDERTLLIYYFLNSNNKEVKDLHIKNQFIENANGILGVYMDKRIIEMLSE